MNSSASIQVRCGDDILTGTSGVQTSTIATCIAMLNDAKAKCAAHEPPCSTTIADIQAALDKLNA